MNQTTPRERKKFNIGKGWLESARGEDTLVIEYHEGDVLLTKDEAERLLSVVQYATEYARHKDMMNSSWHKKEVVHRELTVDLIEACGILTRKMEK